MKQTVYKLLLCLAMLCASIQASAYDFYIDGIYYNKLSNNTCSVNRYDYSGSVVIPNIVSYDGIKYSVTSIDDYAFRGCSDLESVTIPNSVTSIGYYAFSGCSSLNYVEISDLTAWCNIDFRNDLSNPLNYAKLLYLDEELVTNLVIPNEITVVKAYAFYGYKCLNSVTIPNSVTSIGGAAFSDCSGLTTVTIPNSVTSIGNYAFSGCSDCA